MDHDGPWRRCATSSFGSGGGPAACQPLDGRSTCGAPPFPSSSFTNVRASSSPWVDRCPSRGRAPWSAIARAYQAFSAAGCPRGGPPLPCA
eukprot:3595662-Pyramimonas_sp.AAC.1